MKAATILITTMVAGTMAAPGAGQDTKAILVLHTYDQDAPGRLPFDTAFARAVREAGGDDVDLYVETLDPASFGRGAFARRTREYLREKYAATTITAVAVAYGQAMAFVADERDPLFPTVPVAALLEAEPESIHERIAVIYTGNFVRQSVALALALNPRARQVAIIDSAPGDSGSDAVHDQAERQVQALGLRIPTIFLPSLPLDELLARVRGLPRDGIIVFLRHDKGPGGRPISRAEAAREVARVAPAPVYVTSDHLVGSGALGGMVIRLEEEAASLARLAVRLSSESSRSVPSTESTQVPIFDWRQLRRWNIDESLLPPGSEVRFREVTLWDQYRWYVVGASSVTLVQSALIAGLVLQRARRRRTESALRESEGHFRLVADTAPVLIWRSGTDKACDFFNQPWLLFRGRTLEQEAGFGWADGVHPEERESIVGAYVKAFDAREPVGLEYRLARADGEYRWVWHIGVPRSDGEGRFAGYIGSAIDITDRRRIEQRNQDLAGRLLTVLEEERARIARDLHDDVCQQVAGLGIVLSALKDQVGTRDCTAAVGETISSLQERTMALAHAIRTLSHGLHPSVLDHAGLAAALRRHCADVAEQHHLDVSFSASDGLDSLPSEVQLGLFRVAQEALTNAVRHAHARTIRVQLTATSEGTELRVDDDGIGFIASDRTGGGLGLRSMGERVRLIAGDVRVVTRPGEGTRVLVNVPSSAAVTRRRVSSG